MNQLFGWLVDRFHNRNRIMPRDQPKNRSTSRRKSRSKRRSKSRHRLSKRDGFENAINAIKTTAVHIERKFEKEVADKILTDEMVAASELYSKRIVRAVGNTLKTASEQNICSGDISVTSDVMSMHPISTVQLNSSTKAKRQMIDEADYRRNEIKQSMERSQYVTADMVSTYFKDNVMSRLSPLKQRLNNDEEKKLKAELKAAYASFAKLEAVKIAMKEKHNKVLKSILTEMVKAEKRFKKEQVDSDGTKRLLQEKNKQYEERIEELEKALQSKQEGLDSKADETSVLKNESEQISILEKNVADQHIMIHALTEETSRLKDKLIAFKTGVSEEHEKENNAMVKQLEISISEIESLQLISKEKDQEIEMLKEEIEMYRFRVMKTQKVMDENFYLKKKLLDLSQTKIEQKMRLRELTQESEKLQEEIRSLKKNVVTDSREDRESSVVSDQTSSAAKSVMKALMKEMHALTIENNALQKQLSHNNESDVDSPKSLRGTILSLDDSSSFVSLLADVEREMSSLKENQINDTDFDDAKDSSTISSIDMPSAEVTSKLPPLREKQSTQQSSFDKSSDPSFGTCDGSKGNVASQNKQFLSRLWGSALALDSNGWISFD